MRTERGSFTVEAALGIPVLILTVFAWFDLCVMGYAFAMGDHALSVAVSETKKLGSVKSSNAEDYNSYVSKALLTSGGGLLSALIDIGSIKTEVHYFQDLEKLSLCDEAYPNVEECPGASSNAKNMAIAIYGLEYDYKPIFSYVLKPLHIRREITAIQEYERCAFKLKPGEKCEKR